MPPFVSLPGSEATAGVHAEDILHLTEQKEFVAKSIPQKTAKFLPHRPRRGRPLRTRTKTCLRLPLRPVPGVCLARPDRAPPPRPPFLTVPAAAACAPLVQGRLRHPGDPVVAACAQPRLLSPPPQRAFRTGRRSWGNSEQKDPKTAAVGKIDEEEALFSEEVASGDCGGGGGGSDARQRPLMAVLRRRRRQRTPCVALSLTLLFAECTLHRGEYVQAHTRPGGVCTVQQYTANEDRGREGLSIGHEHTHRERPAPPPRDFPSLGNAPTRTLALNKGISPSCVCACPSGGGVRVRPHQGRRDT